MKKEPRLQFTDEERNTPELKKSIRKAEKAATKAERTQTKLPQKKVRTYSVDPQTGTIRTTVRLEEKKPPGKLSLAARDAPGNLISTQFHRELSESEKDNIGVESAHKLGSQAEAGGRLMEHSRRAQKFKPYKRAERAERRLEKANLDVLYREAELEHPTTNPASRWQQRRAIKKQYAAAKSGQTTQTVSGAAEAASHAARRVSEEAKKAVEAVWTNPKGAVIVLLIILLLASMLSALSSCSAIVEGVGAGIAASTYPSEDDAMLGAEEVYRNLEAELQNRLDHYETTHHADAFVYDLDDIEHDPYVLISIVTALKHGEWTLAEVQPTLKILFEKQYILTESVSTETRYRSEQRTGYRLVTDEASGQTHREPYTYTAQVPYAFTTCTVKLENFNLAHLPIYIMNEEELSMYAMYMATLGNRPDLFPQSSYVEKYGSYTDYEIPPEALKDEQFAAIIHEAEKYLGYPYVWGGYNPSTSFDCSGFVSWVINHSGWNYGRLGVDSLWEICTPTSSPKPGDLVFFEGTYETDGLSHVGIYVGEHRMIHCGDPISYADLSSSYWQAHLYGYGRLP